MSHSEMNAMAAPPQGGGVPVMANNPMMEYPLKDITVPHPHDVLCGRGGATNNHLGNSHWRMLVSTNKELYVTLPKRQKQLLSRSIVLAVRSQNPPGRFLQRDAQSDLWYDVGDARATEKTSQALREGAPKLRDKIVKTTATTSGESTEEATATPVATPSAVVTDTKNTPVTPPQPNTAVSAQLENPRAQKQEPAYPNPAQQQQQQDNGQEPYPYYHHHHPDTEAMPPPPMPMAGGGDFSFGTTNVPGAPDLGLENGYSFGSVMSVDPQQRQRQNSQNSLLMSGGSVVPMPTALQGQEFSFGSMIMSEAEQRRLEQNIIREEQQFRHQQLQNQQHQHYPTRIDERHEEEVPLPVDYGLEAGNSALSMMSIGTIQTLPGMEQQQHRYGASGDQMKPSAFSFGSMTGAREQSDRSDEEHQQHRHHYDESAPQPVDYGLEAGSSALSMMSIGTIKLDDVGTSFGSVMSYATNNRHGVPGAVDGGLQDIGTSFGSMTIGNDGDMAPPPPVVKDAFEPPEPSAEPTFLLQQRSKANLLDCGDSDSEDEQHSAQASLQKSADWAKLKATFESQMQSGNMATSAAMPPSLYGMNRGRGDLSPVVLPRAVGRSKTNDSLGNMPPPASRKEEDAWHAYEATLLNRGNSLADEHFNVPKEVDDSK
mmetsp:Transcript_3527/g.6739  ORF Transcript_3527/g.6739 Transcript_3527/m.6739 type:complete len:655 (+) Transcript_3527:199-2163(+)